MTIDDVGLDEWAAIGRAFLQGSPASLLPIPMTPCVVSSRFAGVALGVSSSSRVLVAFSDGIMDWMPMEEVTLKYQPHSEWRLMLGWGEKGPAGNGRTLTDGAESA